MNLKMGCSQRYLLFDLSKQGYLQERLLCRIAASPFLEESYHFFQRTEDVKESCIIL